MQFKLREKIEIGRREQYVFIMMPLEEKYRSFILNTIKDVSMKYDIKGEVFNKRDIIGMGTPFLKRDGSPITAGTWLNENRDTYENITDCMDKGRWIPAKYDYETREVQLESTANGDLPHRIYQTFEALIHIKFCLSLIGNPKEIIIIKRLKPKRNVR